MTAARRAAAAPILAGVALAVALLTAGCGSTGAVTSPSAPASVPLPTSLGGPGQPGWAAVQMGGSSSDFNNFWELFSRPAGSAQWELSTPLGVASNGGLVMAASGGGLVAGFRPSQDLTFSPLASTAGADSAWSSAAAPVSPGLASVPDALAAGPGGRMLALTGTGEVLAGTGGGWTRLATVASLNRTTAGRACGLTSLTAVAFTQGGTPLIGARCARAGRAGIFALGSSWQAVGPAAGGRVTVLGLVTADGRTTALLEASVGSAADALAAWSATGTGGWTISAALNIGANAPRSVDIWANGSAALVLPGARGATIAGPGANWQWLPSLPGRTATLALGQSGQLQALAVDGSRLTIWQAAGTGWNRLQEISVKIPYGSSS